MADSCGLSGNESRVQERDVYLPLQSVERCFVCHKSRHDAKLKMCTSCSQVLYCSNECQRKDWKAHKAVCGVTDRIDLESYYPFLSLIIYMCHNHAATKCHPAIRHKIINSPNPDAGQMIDVPNGGTAKLVRLGDEMGMYGSGTPNWWPSAKSDNIRTKLLRRIITEGFTLPVVLATTAALLSEMYTTTSCRSLPGSKGHAIELEHRVRLEYKGSPLSDFGIVAGSAPVAPEDRLVYRDRKGKLIMMSQHPDDYYWIYFTTLAGEQIYLDCNMFTFNGCHVVETKEHAKAQRDVGPIGIVPGYLYGREERKAKPGLYTKIWKPRKHFSVLRNSRLQEFASTCKGSRFCFCHTLPMLCDVMKEISGHNCLDMERENLLDLMAMANVLVSNNITTRSYYNFPAQAERKIESDDLDKPVDESEEEYDREFEKYLIKLSQKVA